MASSGTLAIVLCRAPDLGRVAYRATSTCSHAVTEQIVFGRVETLLEHPASLGVDHWRRVGCHCQVGEVALRPEPAP